MRQVLPLRQNYSGALGRPPIVEGGACRPFVTGLRRPKSPTHENFPQPPRPFDKRIKERGFALWPSPTQCLANRAMR